jgi:hypothetical protein
MWNDGEFVDVILPYKSTLAESTWEKSDVFVIYIKMKVMVIKFYSVLAMTGHI